jgi:hypothetical protein
MTKEPAQRLTGEDAWLANKRAIAKRNEEARARAAEQSAPHEAKAAARRREIDRRERDSLPEQPA